MEYKKITENDLVGKGVVGQPDTPALSALEMQNKVEEVVRDVVIPAFNGLVGVVSEDMAARYTKEETDKAIGDKLTEIGAGDMQKAVYDTDGDGTVDKAKEADNGLFTYVHSGNSLTGKGENGRFKAVAGGTYTSFTVNGTACSVKCGEDTEIDLVAGAWYTFILDGNTINFKQGGAGLNFKIVGGTAQPASPKENTIWVNTDLEITGWGFDTEPAEYLTTGGVWIKTSTNGNVEFNALKKNGICIYPQSCMQWDGTKYVSKDVKVYKNGQWLALKIWFLQGGEPYRDATGGWAVIDTPNGAHQPATIDGDGITFLTTANTYREIATELPVDFTNINTLYFSVPRISLSGGDYRRFSMGINSTRTHKLVNNNEAEGWLVEKFIKDPQPATNLLYSLDTSSVNTECYILAVTGCGGGTTLTVVINEIYGV